MLVPGNGGGQRVVRLPHLHSPGHIRHVTGHTGPLCQIKGFPQLHGTFCFDTDLISQVGSVVLAAFFVANFAVFALELASAVTCAESEYRFTSRDPLAVRDNVTLAGLHLMRDGCPLEIEGVRVQPAFDPTSLLRGIQYWSAEISGTEVHFGSFLGADSAHGGRDQPTASTGGRNERVLSSVYACAVPNTPNPNIKTLNHP